MLSSHATPQAYLTWKEARLRQAYLTWKESRLRHGLICEVNVNCAPLKIVIPAQHYRDDVFAAQIDASRESI